MLVGHLDKFLKTKFDWLAKSAGGSKHISMPNFVEIGPSIAEILIFQLVNPL